MYRIFIKGRLTARLAGVFSGMRVDSDAENTSLTGWIRDQSELYGLLDCIRNLGLDLVSVQPGLVTAADTSADRSSRGS